MKTIKISLVVLCFLFLSEHFAQSIPTTINYQGVLKDASGNIVPNDDYNCVFSIYNTETGGTALWSETKTLSTDHGIFSTQLGSVTAITLPFDAAYWLGVSVEGTELSPRIAFTSVPYSRMSLTVPDNSLTAAKISSGEVVKSLNGIKDNVNLVAGSNVTIIPGGNNITISATGGGGGTVTQVNTGAGLTGGPITTSGTISVSNDAITNAMLQNNSVTSAKIVDGTISAADIANTQVVKSLNSLRDNVTLVAGSNVTITPSGNNLTISSSAGGLGGTGTTNYLPRFTGSTTLGNSNIYESSGNIGIGTTSPTVRLDVSGSAHVAKFDGASNQMYISLYENGIYRGYIGSYSGNAADVDFGTGIGSSGSTHLVTSAVPRLTITSSGRVGIGTTSPSSTSQMNVVTNINENSQGIRSVFSGTSTTDGIAFYGSANTSPGKGIGGTFIGGFRGVIAQADGQSVSGGGLYGVLAEAVGTGSTFKAGVYGYANGPGTSIGVYGETEGAGTQFAVYGLASGTGTTWAGYFAGNVAVTGTLSKGGGSFKIDHPLDPANKYLYHSFVESPDMMNIYNGNVVTDGSGYATVSLPEWFEALNKDFRYQLTVIGDFAQAIISQKVHNNQFTIRTDKQNIEVSWQVTGIRKDAFAEKHRIPIEELKPPDEIGKYAHPEAFGLPKSMGIDNIQLKDRKPISIE